MLLKMTCILYLRIISNFIHHNLFPPGFPTRYITTVNLIIQTHAVFLRQTHKVLIRRIIENHIHFAWIVIKTFHDISQYTLKDFDRERIKEEKSVSFFRYIILKCVLIYKCDSSAGYTALFISYGAFKYTVVVFYANRVTFGLVSHEQTDASFSTAIIKQSVVLADDSGVSQPVKHFVRSWNKST